MKLPEGVLGNLLATGDCWTLWATRADAGDAACAAGAGAVRLWIGGPPKRSSSEPEMELLLLQ